MTRPDPYSTSTQHPPHCVHSRPSFLHWLYLAVFFSIVHGLLAWWSITHTSGGFWVMEGGGSTLTESVADALTLFLNLPSILVCLAVGFPPFGFRMPFFAIANSCLWGSALALIVVNIKKTKIGNAARSRS